MSSLSLEQARELKAEFNAKKDRAFAEYNRCVGALRVLDLIDGSVDIVEEKVPDGETS